MNILAYNKLSCLFLTKNHVRENISLQDWVIYQNHTKLFELRHELLQ